MTVEEKIGYRFKNPALLEEALTHRSYINEHKHVKSQENERLEFLGDAVLDLVTAEFLFKRSEEMEGVLSTTRAFLVKTDTLAEVAKNTLQLEEYMRFSHGQAKTHPRSIFAGAYEALIGAIYLDGGLPEAEKFINRTILNDFEKITEGVFIKDAKTRFQEGSQRAFSITPTYQLLKEEGLPHKRNFTVGVYIENQQIAKGKGASKKEAETNAALNALNHYKWEE